MWIFSMSARRSGDEAAVANWWTLVRGLPGQLLVDPMGVY
jgi:hypothetical protein